VNVVFPEVKDRCMRKGLKFIDIDLRWGVLEENERSKTTLEICFDEIDKCHPYFIGILGERFGNIPTEEKLPKPAVELLEEQVKEKNSFTALEIYYAFLKKKGFCKRAFFYFRDPEFISSIPKLKKTEFTSESGESEKKLGKLKNFIKTELERGDLNGHLSGYKCEYKGLRLPDLSLSNNKWERQQENILREVVQTNPRLDDNLISQLNPFQKEMLKKHGSVVLDKLNDFGLRVLEDLWKTIQDDIPANIVQKDSFSLERSFQLHFITNLLNTDFIGRRNELTQLRQYIMGGNNHPAFVSGKSGSGKTALLAKLFSKLTSDSKEKFSIIPHFIGASPDSSKLLKTLRRLILEIYFEIGKSEFKIAEGYEQVREQFFDALYIFSKVTNKKIIFLIDAVNQFSSTNEPENLRWIPKTLPDNVKLILSIADEEQNVSDRKDWVRNMKEVGLLEIRIGELSSGERTKICRKYFISYGKEIDGEMFAKLFKKDDSDRPLYIKIACEELRVFPYRNLLEQNISLFPASIGGLFETLLLRLESSYNAEIVRLSLSLIACSRYGLREDELIELMEISGRRIPKLTWLNIYWGIKPYIHILGDNREGNIAFFHKQLFIAVSKKYLSQPKDLSLIFNILSHYGLGIFEKLRYSVPPENRDSLNCFWDLGIYLLKSEGENVLDKIQQFLTSLFSLPMTWLGFYSEILDKLFYYILFESALKEETERFMKILSGLCSHSTNESLAYFLVKQGNNAIESGLHQMALAFFNFSIDIFNNILKQQPDNIEVLRSLSASYNKRGEVYELINDSVLALVSFEKDLKISRMIFEKAGGCSNYGSEIITTLNIIGDHYKIQNNLQQTFEYYSRALELSRILTSNDPSESENTRDLSICLIKTADLYCQSGKLTEAIPKYQEAVEIRENDFHKNPQDIKTALTLSSCYEKLSYALLHSGSSDEAIETLTKARSLFHESYQNNWRDESTSVIFSRIYELLALVYFQIGRIKQGFMCGKEAMDIRERSYHEDLFHTDKALDYTKSILFLGEMYLKIGNLKDAKNHFEKALEIRNEVYNKDLHCVRTKRLVSESYKKMGDLYAMGNNIQEAGESFMNALAIMSGFTEKEYESNEILRDISIIHQRLGDHNFAKGEIKIALAHYEENLRISMNLHEKNVSNTEMASDLAMAYLKLAEVFVEIQQKGLAKMFTEKAYACLKQNTDEDKENMDKLQDLAICLNRLGDLSLEEDKKGAMDYYMQSLRIQQKILENDKLNIESIKNVSIIIEKVGNLYLKAKEYEVAERYYLECLDLRLRAYKHSEQMFFYGIDLAEIFYKHGKSKLLLGMITEGHKQISKGLDILVMYEKSGKFEEYPQYYRWIEQYKAKLSKPGSIFN